MSLLTVSGATFGSDIENCVISVDGSPFAVLKYQRGSLDILNVNEMGRFASDLNEVAFVTISKEDGSIRTNSGQRSMNTGVRASNHVKAIIEEELSSDYEIECTEARVESSHWGGNN